MSIGERVFSGDCTVLGAGVWDSSAGGNLLYWGLFDVARTFRNGDRFSLEPNAGAFESQRCRYLTPAARRSTRRSPVLPARAARFDGLAGLMNTAGWTYVSGQGTEDVLMQSYNNNAGGAIRVQIADPGSGNCARVRLHSVDETRVQAGGSYLLPAAGKVSRVLAGRH